MSSKTIITILIILVLSASVYIYQNTRSVSTTSSEEVNDSTKRLFSKFSTNLESYSLHPEKLIRGGPGKDVIPALSDPSFTDISKATVSDETMGILVEIEGIKKYYPFNILVWHEIVNDSIGNIHFAVTFCPLCGSAIVFDRTLEGQTYEFGVSGFLYDSNMIMFDRTTETLWQQSTGKAIIGDLLDSQLNLINMQRVQFKQIKDNHPNAQVLSRDTGHNRNYDIYPYGDYDTNDQIIFPVSFSDSTFDAKEIMYVVLVEDVSVAVKISDIYEDSSYTKTIDQIVLTMSQEDSEITVTNNKGEVIPGYYEMWFSWATQHTQDGEVWSIKN